MDEITQRLDRIEAMLRRQTGLIEATRSDLRMLSELTRGMFTILQGLAGGYADLSSRVTDLENPEVT